MAITFFSTRNVHCLPLTTHAGWAGRTMITAPDTSPPIEEQNSAFKALPPRKQVSNLMNPRTHHLGKVGKVIEESGTLEMFEVVVLADFMLHLWRYQDLVCSQRIPSWWRIFFTETVATHWNNPVFGRHGFLEWPVTTWRRTHHKRPGQERASILKGF